MPNQLHFRVEVRSTSCLSMLQPILFAKDRSLLSVVDEPAFRHLLEIAELRLGLPRCTYSMIPDTVIPAKYCSTRAATEKQLAEVENSAVTTDLWTSQHQQLEIHVCMHFACLLSYSLYYSVISLIYIIFSSLFVCLFAFVPI